MLKLPKTLRRLASAAFALGLLNATTFAQDTDDGGTLRGQSENPSAEIECWNGEIISPPLYRERTIIEGNNELVIQESLSRSEQLSYCPQQIDDPKEPEAGLAPIDEEQELTEPDLDDYMPADDIICELPDYDDYSQADEEEARAAAQNGLRTFIDLIDSVETRDFLEIPEAQDISDIAVDESIKVYVTPWKSLRDAILCDLPDSTLPRLFRPVDQFLFNITVDDAPQAMLRTARIDNDGVRAVEFGLPVLTEAIAAGKRDIKERFCIDADAVDFVAMPDVDMEFLAFRCGSNHWMTPLEDNHWYLKPGRYYRAARVKRFLTQEILSVTEEPG